MAANNRDITIAQYDEYDQVLSRKAETIISKMIEKDTKREQPVDRHPFFIEYIRYCVCKLYGIMGDLENHKQAHAVFVFLYWKTTQESYATIIKRIGGDKATHSRAIKQVTMESDKTRLNKNMYLQQKAEDFYRKM